MEALRHHLYLRYVRTNTTLFGYLTISVFKASASRPRADRHQPGADRHQPRTLDRCTLGILWQQVPACARTALPQPYHHICTDCVKRREGTLHFVGRLAVRTHHTCMPACTADTGGWERGKGGEGGRMTSRERTTLKETRESGRGVSQDLGASPGTDGRRSEG